LWSHSIISKFTSVQSTLQHPQKKKGRFWRFKEKGILLLLFKITTQTLEGPLRARMSKPQFYIIHSAGTYVTLSCTLLCSSPLTTPILWLTIEGRTSLDVSPTCLYRYRHKGY
jgi:hypothetical protein